MALIGRVWPRALWMAALLSALWLPGLVSAAKAESILRLATSTSLDNSGLMTLVEEAFERRFPIDLRVIAVGTGKALKLGRDGEVDALLTHAPQDERALAAQGYVVHLTPILFNYFALIGPADDPAAIRDASVVRALRLIHNHRARFVSRGDDSGTHKFELALWRRNGIPLKSRPLYLETGQSMGRTLQIADQLRGYTLSDRGTWLALRMGLDLVEFAGAGEPGMKNIYSVMAVNPQRYPDLNYRDARSFIDWLLQDEAEQLFLNFRHGGDLLFEPWPR